MNEEHLPKPGFPLGLRSSENIIRSALRGKIKLSCMKLREAKGRMFKSVTHTGTFFRGCDHGCLYCCAEQVLHISHDPHLVVYDEMQVLKVRDAIIFLNSAHDSFANCIPNEWISMMLRWIGRQDSSNKFLLQTKNPSRMPKFLKNLLEVKDRVRLGTTLETTFPIDHVSKAIIPQHRAFYLAKMREYGFETFLSLEPLMKFKVSEMLYWIRAIQPVMIEIGFDNYERQHGQKFEKPSHKEYAKFINQLDKMGFKYIEKDSIKKWQNDYRGLHKPKTQRRTS